MTALTHAVVVSLPDNPAYEVSKNAWNQAHPLPGTIGQLFASDGASGVDAIPQLVYNSTTGSFNVAVDSALGGVFQIFDVQGTRGMFAFDPVAGNLSADKLMPVTALSGLLDLGGPANLWKDGYFGTSVVTPLLKSVGGATDLTLDTVDASINILTRAGNFVVDLGGNGGYSITGNNGQHIWDASPDGMTFVEMTFSNTGILDAPAYSVNGTPGLVTFSGLVTSITVDHGIVTAAS